MLQDLPEFAHQLLIDQHLSELEVKTLRLVCKECKSMVDTSLTTLRPKDIAKLKLGEIVKLFPNLESLDLTQHDDSTDPDDYMPEFWQLPALARLKSLKVHWDWDCNVIRQVIPGGGLTGLTTLHYEIKDMAEEDLVALSCMSGLRELSLHGASSHCTRDGCRSGITGTGLVHLKDLPHLQSLDVSSTNITCTEGLHALANLTRLTALNINNAVGKCDPDPDDSWNTLPRRDVPEVRQLLSCLTGLRELCLQGYGIVPNQGLLDQLAGLSRLTALDIDAPLHDEYIHDPIEGSSLLSLRELKVLKANWWNIYFKPVVASSGKSVFAELALTELNASTWQHADHKVINKFKLLHAALRGGKLKILVLTGDYTSDDHENILGKWAQATALTSLHFCDCNMGWLSGLQRVQTLKSLTFEGCRFEIAEEVRHLSSLTNLETLQFNHCNLPRDTCLAPILGHLSALVTLQIPESEAVTVELLGQVAQLSALQDLDLPSRHVKLDQGDLRRLLSALPHLTALKLRGLNTQDRELNVIRHLKHLRSLNLYGGDFTDDGLRMLTGLTVLRSLKLGYCDKITDKGFRALIVSLSQQCLARVDVDSRYNSKPLSSARRMGVVCCEISGIHTDSDSEDEPLGCLM